MWFIAQKPQEQNLQILEGLTAPVCQWIVSFLFSLFLLQSAPGVVHLWAFLVLTRVIWWYSCAHKYNLTLNKCIPRWQVLPAGAYCSALGSRIPKSKSSAWGHCRPVPIWWNHWLIFFLDTSVSGYCCPEVLPSQTWSLQFDQIVSLACSLFHD